MLKKLNWALKIPALSSAFKSGTLAFFLFLTNYHWFFLFCFLIAALIFLKNLAYFFSSAIVLFFSFLYFFNSYSFLVLLLFFILTFIIFEFQNISLFQKELAFLFFFGTISIFSYFFYQLNLNLILKGFLFFGLYFILIKDFLKTYCYLGQCFPSQKNNILAISLAFILIQLSFVVLFLPINVWEFLFLFISFLALLFYFTCLLLSGAGFKNFLKAIIIFLIIYLLIFIQVFNNSFVS